MSEKQNKFRYIYNLQQAYYYIQNGIIPIKAPYEHKTTHKICFIFDEAETKEAYDKWCNRI